MSLPFDSVLGLIESTQTENYAVWVNSINSSAFVPCTESFLGPLCSQTTTRLAKSTYYAMTVVARRTRQPHDLITVTLLWLASESHL